MARVGYIGLGLMGSGMARNLLRAGHTLVVHNRSRRPVDELAAEGAVAAKTPAEVARQADVVITMLPDTPDVELVLFGENGVFEGARRGLIVVDMSTISPEATREMASRLAEKGVEMLDAPVSGGDVGAQAGTLAIMAGGKREVFERCLPIFRVLGKSITYMGSNGMGQTTKLCNQILVSVTNLAVSEALLFASKMGVDPAKVIEATRGGAAGSWQLANLGPKMVQRDFAPGFMIKLQQKDLRLALESARRAHLPLLGVSMVHQLFASCEAAGEENLGTQALVKALERLAGTEVTKASDSDS